MRVLKFQRRVNLLWNFPYKIGSRIRGIDLVRALNRDQTENDHVTAWAWAVLKQRFCFKWSTFEPYIGAMLNSVQTASGWWSSG